MIYIRIWKRLFDFFAAILCLSFLLPLFIFSSLGILLSSPGPILFKQTRVGMNGVRFKIFKFRTLHVNTHRPLSQTSNFDKDVFLFGGFLRRYKVDELPQLFNILKGDMSFVGPRPFVPEIYSSMPVWAQARCQVRPGLTGLAQVNGNASLSWEDKWRFDLLYLNRLGFIFDLLLLFKTIFVVFIGEKYFVPKL